MTAFWIIAAALVLLALVFVVVPLLQPAPQRDGPDQDALNIEVCRRLAELDADLAAGALDQDRYDAAKKDLERELVYDLGGHLPASQSTAGQPAAEPKSKSKRKGKTRKSAAPEPAAPTPDRSPILALLLAIALPAAAVAAYLQLGSAGIIPLLADSSLPRSQPQDAAHRAAGTGAQELPPMDVLAEQLAAKMEQHPDNLAGWLMLGRTYFAIREPEKALGAFERAYKLAPGNADVLLAYAEAIAVKAGNQLDGRPAELIAEALRIDPANPSARWLDGMRAYQQGAFSEAVETWQGILAEMDPEGEEARDLRDMIADARAKAGEPAPAANAPPPLAESAPEPAVAAEPQPAVAAVEEPTAAPPARIEVSISLDPALADQAEPGDTVFVFARASAGPPMPLAAGRLRVSDLPARVTLDDSMAMMPAMRLSAFPEVTVGARISKSGQATPQSGDLEGAKSPVSTAEPTAVSVVIAQVRP